MRRLAVLASLAAIAIALLARRRARTAPAGGPLAGPPRSAPAAALAVPADFVSVPWTLADAPADRRELALRYACDASMVLDRVDAQETPTQVFVTVLMRRTAAAGGAAPRREEREATVQLSAPLGDRELVRAPVDEDPPPAADEPTVPPLYP
jgi:hypothetical protein